MAGYFTFEPPVSETRFSPQKTQNLASEMSLKNASLGGILTQNGSPPVDSNIPLLIGEIRVFADKISLTLKVDGLKDLASEMAVSGYFYEPHGEPEKFPETAQEVLDDGSIRMTMQLESKKIDGHRRVVIPAPGEDRMRQQSLLRAIRNGQRWMEMLINGEAKNITDLAAKLGLKPPYVTRVLGLNNLAPDIVEAIVAGTEPDGLSIAQIMKNIPEDWNEQRRFFGFPER